MHPYPLAARNVERSRRGAQPGKEPPGRRIYDHGRRAWTERLPAKAFENRSRTSW